MTGRWMRVGMTAAAALGPVAVMAAAGDGRAPIVTATTAQYAMPFTQSFDLASDTGQIYRILVSYPKAEPPPNGFPVLYVLDGNAMFAGFAEARRIQEYSDVGKAIVVGIGYPGDEPYDVRRLDDYTPKLIDPPPPGLREFAKYPSGGQDRFLDFLTGRLRAEIGRRFRIDPDRQSLFGHSLGGLFGLHALFTRPGAFEAIVAASPSLDWDDQAELRDERPFVARMTTGKVAKTSRLLIVVGDRDVDDDPFMAEALYRRLDPLSAYGLRTRVRRYDDEVHISVPSRAVTDTLRFVFTPR